MNRVEYNKRYKEIEILYFFIRVSTFFFPTLSHTYLFYVSDKKPKKKI
jgi:hypothetical protein